MTKEVPPPLLPRNVIMFFCFFRPTTSVAGDEPPNEAALLNPWPRRLALLACAGGGFLYAAALPPLNFSFAAFFALLPVMVYVSLERRWYMRALAGWLWGWCWAICAYFWLREIEWFVPWLLAPVIALFPTVWAVVTGIVSRSLLFPPLVEGCGMDSRRQYLARGPRLWRLILMGLHAAALYIVIEYTRSRLFVWNDLAVTQYRNLVLIQLAALIGSYGVGFGVALVNSAWWMLFFRRGWRAAIVLMSLAVLLFLSGWCYARWRHVPKPDVEWKVLAIQGDLSQRRHATEEEAAEALTVYGELSEQGLAQHPDADITVWPEGAIPVLYHSNLQRCNIRLPEGDLTAEYQRIVRDLTLIKKKKMLLGALDIEEATLQRMKSNDPPLGVTNSALLIDAWGGVIGRYDKYHRVPFGEYVPFRRYLPDSWIKMIDMGRDLVPGQKLTYIAELPAGEGGRHTIRPGVVICYEGVFSYVTRGTVLHGANVLVALSNDAWYPRSCEPEQHLANATLRAVECGVPMVRVGNNSGSGIVMPDGSFAQALEVPGPESRPELRRGRGVRLLRVPVTEFPSPTLFLRIGDLFPILLIAFVILMYLYARWQRGFVFSGLAEMRDTLEREKQERAAAAEPKERS